MAKFARYDRNLLAVQLEELTNLGFDQIDVTGFSIADVAIGETTKKRKSAVDAGDDLPGPQKMVVSRPSDLWVLGPHRLFCEDAAAAANCQALMSGEQADVVLTDGPCSRLRQPGHSNCTMTYGQGLDDFALLSSFLRLATEASKACATMLVSTDCRRLFALLSAAQAQQLLLNDLIVWVTGDADSGNLYRSQYDLIDGDAPPHKFELRRQRRQRSNLWRYPDARPISAGYAEELARHRTCKPVALLADAIQDVSDRGAIVFDPFAGTGSTLIAAEKTGRKAYVIEADPVYCDIIIRRFKAYTGKTARLDESGLSFKEAEKIRATDKNSLDGSIG